ncbi:MAG TPA: 2-dehydropantoate 2-reductase N-terminal domain-containing protein, partial [Candidatus Omnitrophota bacterium]|nr:2-dehydropantoate 2-reductase N-terminal domain-containing protein [Candidatus Omnitrophota bacterium]
MCGNNFQAIDEGIYFNSFIFMTRTIKNISVIGDGGWGTTLAVHLSQKHYPVKLWGPFPSYIRRMVQTRTNEKFLPGIPLNSHVHLTDDLKETITTADLIIFAIPSKYAVSVLKRIKKTHVDLSEKIVLSVTKGIDTKQLLRMSEIIKKELGNHTPVAVLSGPTIAAEVARGIPSTAVVAASHLKTAKSIQEVFNSENFRIYTNTDVTGVELGGSIKNIIALACGVC